MIVTPPEDPNNSCLCPPKRALVKRVYPRKIIRAAARFRVRFVRVSANQTYSAMVRYVTRYISPRSRPLTDAEKGIRQVAYDLKIPTPDAIAFAAPLMAELLEPEPCWLIPIPSSSGSTEANLANMPRPQETQSVCQDYHRYSQDTSRRIVMFSSAGRPARPHREATCL